MHLNGFRSTEVRYILMFIEEEQKHFLKNLVLEVEEEYHLLTNSSGVGKTERRITAHKGEILFFIFFENFCFIFFMIFLYLEPSMGGKIFSEKCIVLYCIVLFCFVL